MVVSIMPTPYENAVANLGTYINGANVEKLDAFTAAAVISIAFGRDKEDVMYDIVDVGRKQNNLNPITRLIKRPIDVGDSLEFASVKTGLRYTGVVTMINQAKGEPIQALYVDFPDQAPATFVPVPGGWQRTCNGAFFTLRVITPKGS